VGLGKLVDTLAAGLTVRQQEVFAIERGPGGFRVRAGSDLARKRIASFWLVRLGRPRHYWREWTPGLASMLMEIPYSSSLTLSLIYKTSEFDGMRAGFGFLIPKCERQRFGCGNLRRNQIFLSHT